MELNFDFGDPKPKGPPNEEFKESDTKSAEVVETTPFDQFDLIKAKTDQSFLTIITKMAEMSKQAAELKVTDSATNETAMQMLVQIKALIKGADDSKARIPAYKIAADYKNGLDRFVLKQIKEPLGRIDPTVRKKVSAYQQSIAELQRKKAAKQAAEDAEKAKAKAEADAKELKEKEEKEKQDAIDLQAKLNLDADEAGVERVSVPIPEVSDAAPIIPVETTVTPKSEKVVADHGIAKIEASWIVRIVEDDKVPIEYCSPDQKKLNAAIECGVKEIAGCVIEETFDPKIRLSKKKQDLNFKF